MKKGLLAVAIWLFLGAGVAVAYGLDRFSSASELKTIVDRSMEKIKAAKSMEDAEGESHMMELDLEMLSKAKQSGMMGLGGGAVLLGASVVTFMKSRAK